MKKLFWVRFSKRKEQKKKFGPFGWLACERALLVFFLGWRAFGGLPSDDSMGVVVLIDVVGMEGGFHYRARGLIGAILLGNLRSSCGELSPI